MVVAVVAAMLDVVEVFEVVVVGVSVMFDVVDVSEVVVITSNVSLYLYFSMDH